MKKINKKTTVTALKNSVNLKKIVRKINVCPIIGLLIIIAGAYAFYRFGIVATVNGKPITRFTYLRNLEKQDKKQTIKQMANEALVFQEAAKKGITIDKSEIDTQVASVEAQIKSQGQTLDAALATEGMTKSDLEAQIRLQQMVEKLANPNVNITQVQIDEYLTQNKSLLPAAYTKEQLQALAKTQLTTQVKNDAIDAWFTELQKTAKIVIR